MRWIALGVALLGLAMPARATVWRVAKDGTGQFSVIQDAVDVAAAGDTIRIGPGRYDDKRLTGNPPWQQYARINIVQREITIIGDGMDRTIIGPAQPYSVIQGNDLGAFADGYYGASVARFMDLRFENVYISLWVGTGTDSLAVLRCSFGGHRTGILAKALESNISQCRFDSVSRPNGIHVLASGPDRVAIGGCVFTLADNPAHGENVSITYAGQAIVTDCTFTGGAIGMSAAGGGDAEARNCRFDGQSLYALSNGVSGTFAVEDCEIINQRSALFQYGDRARWAVERIHVDNVSLATLEYGHLYGGYIRNSILAKGPRFVVADDSDVEWPDKPPVTLDMTDNWWGTADPDSIQAWIFDSNDQPNRPYYYIDWDPYRSQPVAAQRKSLGDVKVLFRGATK